MEDEHGPLLERQPPEGSFELVAIVDGQDAGGFGGTLTCDLFGPLQPINSDNGGASAAPTITLAATV